MQQMILNDNRSRWSLNDNKYNFQHIYLVIFCLIGYNAPGITDDFLSIY